MAWVTKANNPDIRRNTFPVKVQIAGGRIVNENMIIDQNIKTGNYIVYKIGPQPIRNPTTGALQPPIGEVVVIQSNKDQTDGVYKISSGPGAQLTPAPGIDSRDYEKFIITSLPNIADNQRKNYFQNYGPQAATNLGIPGFRGTANPNPPTAGGGTPYASPPLPQAPAPPAPIPDPGGNVPSTTFDPNSSTIKVGNADKLSVAGTYRYPLTIGPDKNTQQDFIKFDVIEYSGRVINQKNQAGAIKIDTSFGKRVFSQESIASIILPIQSGINDENSVTWGGENLDAVSAYFAGKSFNAIQNGLGKTLDEVFRDVGNLVDNQSYQNALKVYLAGQAVGTNNLLSRVTGAIINPNLELLFQGPTLRPFNFTFRLSPRQKEEADQVKKIIRVFKEASAVRRSDADLFLKAPYVFRIRYIDGKNKSNDHQSINLIKECALMSCGVNYTPENTYMTFNDPESTMVSYELNLRFSELEPITSADYQNRTDHPIGY